VKYETSYEKTQSICAKINTNKKSTYIYCSYIRPNSPVSDYIKISSTIDKVLEKMAKVDDIFILGDFNLPGLSWIRSEDNFYYDPINITTDVQEMMTEYFAAKGLHQICNMTNNFGNTLDLVLTSVNDDMYLQEVNPILPHKTSIFHKNFCIYYDFFIITDYRAVIRNCQMIYDFDSANYNLINQKISSTNWKREGNIDEKCSYFMENLKAIIEEYVPRKIKSFSSKPPWWTRECSYRKNRKNKAYKRWVDSGLEVDYNDYISTSNELTDCDINAYLNYVEKIGSKIKTDTKQFYKFINYKKEVKGFPTTMKLESEVSNDTEKITEMFAKYYESVYSPPFQYDANHFKHIQEDIISITDLQIEANDLKKEMKLLNVNKGAGPDGIPPLFLRNTADSLSIPLLEIYNFSLANGCFPKEWKCSYITSIYKSGDRSDIKNYRGVAIQSAIPKLPDKLVTTFMYEKTGAIISLQQHGFMKGRSTVTNLTDYTRFILCNLEDGFQVDSVYTDFSKAFDKIDHDLLIFKLERMGIKGNILK